MSSLHSVLEAPDLSLVVSHIGCEAKGVMEIELRAADGGSLPPFEPGAHLEIRLPNGLVRHYSLCNNPSERHVYRLGVGLPVDSRGGARFMHESLRVGDRLRTSHPRNHFPLVTDASEYCFIAGGIGITPILAMIHHCADHGRRFRLFYCARSRQRAGFYEDVIRIAGSAASFHFDDENAGRYFDAGAALSEIGSGAHVYCCGPTPLMQAVESAGQGRPADHMHFEWFAPKATEPKGEREFHVLLRSTGQKVLIPAGVSVLDALERNGVLVPYSCREGLCATCRTGVISGIPDHRDSVLSVEEKALNQSMLICVSRAHGDAIELDL